LARDLNDLTAIVKELEDKGASLEILDQAIDTSTAAGKAFLQRLGVFAEFETNLRKERQLEGIKNAKEALNPTQLAKKYGVSRATVYNVLTAWDWIDGQWSTEGRLRGWQDGASF